MIGGFVFLVCIPTYVFMNIEGEKHLFLIILQNIIHLTGKLRMVADWCILFFIGFAFNCRIRRFGSTRGTAKRPRWEKNWFSLKLYNNQNFSNFHQEPNSLLWRYNKPCADESSNIYKFLFTEMIFFRNFELLSRAQSVTKIGTNLVLAEETSFHILLKFYSIFIGYRYFSGF